MSRFVKCLVGLMVVVGCGGVYANVGCGVSAGHGELPDLATRGCLGLSMEDSKEVEAYWYGKISGLVSGKVRDGGGVVYLGFLPKGWKAKERVLEKVRGEFRGRHGELDEVVVGDVGKREWKWMMGGDVVVKLVE